MPEPFLSLPAGERELILQEANVKFGAHDPVMLEKDIWVCWALQTVFSLPDAHPMAFRGGTALSKVYGVIDRFSEDVDISLDYLSFGDAFDPFAEGASRNQTRLLSERLKDRVATYVGGVVGPFLDEAAKRLDMDGPHSIWLGDDGETLHLVYPSVVVTAGSYFKNEILLEFGGRNVITPNEQGPVVADIAGLIQDVGFPSATVTALDPRRTFWEKAVLAHVACNRRRLKGRLSRHWFDLARLSDHDIGRAALRDRALLEDVVRHNKVFFHAGGANYDHCLQGGLRLVPNDDHLDDLKTDYEKMREAGAVGSSPPEFDALMERLRILEAGINSPPLADNDLPKPSPFGST